MIPKTRAECIDGPRPCPYTTCKHNMKPTASGETCVLDFAARGGMPPGEIAYELRTSRQAIEQTARRAYIKVLHAAKQAGVDMRDFLDLLHR